MSLIKGRNTRPELVVRKLLHRLGYRYRLHVAGLPGKPDIVLTKYRSVIFVHGCFWHRHDSAKCKLARLPKSRINFWTSKLEGNKVRDKENLKKLTAAGWRALVIWECQLKDIDVLTRRVTKFLKHREVIRAVH